MEINKKDTISDIVVRDISEELSKATEGSGGSEVLGITSNDIKFNSKFIVKMAEYTPISGVNINEINKIPELFCNKRSLLILKDNDNKCSSYCYVRKFLNPITKNSFRITKKDKEIADRVINETNLTFENVSINELNKIEKRLEININVFSCNKNYKNKNPVRKSKEYYDKILDLLLIENINHYIIIRNLHCFLTNICTIKDNFICRTCLNIFYSENKYNDHINYCKTRKPQRLLPSNEKYIKFNKLQNCMLNNFTIYSDFECIIGNPNNKYFSINQLEYVIFLKTEINMKLEIKDEFPEYETNINTDNLPKNKIMCKNNKVIHHDHCLPENNILGYICNECNLQTKNKKEIPIIFHNGMKYDNSILFNGMLKFKPQINCIGITSEKFKSIEFKFKEFYMNDDGEAHEIKSNYSLKVIDSLNLLIGSLDNLSTNLDNKYKHETKKEFKDKFEIINKKMNFPYEWINEENLNNKELPKIKDFYSSLKLKTISEEEYNKTKEIYDKLEFKNIKEYLDTYLKSDITLLCDIFENFRKSIWDKFKLDCTQYISSPSLSKDSMLKFSGVKIKHIKDIEMYDFINNSVIGGLCVCSNSYLNNDNNNSTITYQDVSSLYPAIMVKKYH